MFLIKLLLLGFFSLFSSVKVTDCAWLIDRYQSFEPFTEQEKKALQAHPHIADQLAYYGKLYREFEAIPAGFFENLAAQSGEPYHMRNSPWYVRWPNAVYALTADVKQAAVYEAIKETKTPVSKDMVFFLARFLDRFQEPPYTSFVGRFNQAGVAYIRDHYRRYFDHYFNYCENFWKATGQSPVDGRERRHNYSAKRKEMSTADLFFLYKQFFSKNVAELFAASPTTDTPYVELSVTQKEKARRALQPNQYFQYLTDEAINAVAELRWEAFRATRYPAPLFSRIKARKLVQDRIEANIYGLRTELKRLAVTSVPVKAPTLSFSFRPSGETRSLPNLQKRRKARELKSQASPTEPKVEKRQPSFEVQLSPFAEAQIESLRGNRNTFKRFKKIEKVKRLLSQDPFLHGLNSQDWGDTKPKIFVSYDGPREADAYRVFWEYRGSRTIYILRIAPTADH